MVSKRRSLKVLGLAVVAVLAFAVMASAASAARHWTTGGAHAKLVGSAPVTCSTSTGFVLVSHVGAVEIVLNATGVDCINGSKIENVGSEGSEGVDSGTLEFTGVTVSKPRNCSVPGGTITTNPLKTRLIEPAGDKVRGYDLFEPNSGAEFVTVTVAGSTCAVAGEYPIEGSIAGRGNEWGKELTAQPLEFSSAIDAVTGHSLTFGEEPATMTGTATNVLESGALFGAQ